MRNQDVGIQVRRQDWGKKLTMLMLALLIATGQWMIGLSPAEAAVEASGSTYFTDTDNWGGGAGSSTADDDMDISIKNQNKTTADNYAKYPVEFKITNVDRLPTKSAQLLIRANDVDEYIEKVPGNGEWDRVYFSSNPSDIALGASYTPWQTTSTWTKNIQDSKVGVNGQDYMKEITEGAYLGALSGQDSSWNTSVLTFKPDEWKRIALGDNYVGVSIHHYYQDTRTGTGSALANTNWTMKVDWGQLVIDGGIRKTGEITEAGLKVENGKVTIDTSFIPKVAGNNFAMEVNVIEKTLVNGQVVERNVGLDKKFFDKPTEGQEVDWNKIVLTDSGINPSKEYVVNIILFDDRGNGVELEKYTNPGEAQHVVTFSTHDPIVKDISKSGLRSDPTEFTAKDFKDKYLMVNGNAANGDNLESVKIITLPDPTKGVLELDGSLVTAGQKIPVGELGKLAFVPVTGGFDGTIDFLWNGYNGTIFAPADAKVTVNSSPEVKDISVFMKIGDPLFPFTGTNDFIPNYVDPGSEPLATVKIVTLPDPLKGKLVLDDGAGGVTDVTVNQLIDVSDLTHLKFIPIPGVTGEVTFEWNGSDGLQYAVKDKTITITINTPPVVGIVMKSGVEGSAIGFAANNFALAPAYTDTDLDELTEVRIDLPSDFALSGKLGYATVTGTVYYKPGESVTLKVAELNNLVFEPALGLTPGINVEFPWVGSDGMHFSDNLGKVIISYKKLPIAEPNVYNEEEGVSSILIVLEGNSSGTVTGVTYDSIVTDPLKGVLTQDPTDPNGLTWTYIPNIDFQLGTDSFTYTVRDEKGNVSAPVEITIHINKALDGWVGNKGQGDPTIVKAIPGQPLKLSALSTQSADGVTALISGVEVPLMLMNSSTWATDGYKQWENMTFILPSNTATGQHTVSFVAVNGTGDVLQTESASKLIDNNFQVTGASLSLTANPEKIVGDGHSTTDIKALLLDENGVPIVGVEVVFTAPEGSFVGPNHAVTDAEGKATVTYQSASNTGVNEKDIIILATANDTNLGLNAQAAVNITFMPASIHGVITKGDTNVPVAGVVVRVTLDLDGDGLITPGIDFDETVITKTDGSYDIVVPKGDAVYELEVQQTVNIGGVDTIITYKQTAKVDKVSGAGEEEFDSEKTITGIVLFKQPSGQSTLLNNDIVSKSIVYLKKSDGSYVSSNGVPTAYSLNQQGVFHADGLALGEYELEVRYEIELGKQITFSRSKVSVKASGEMNITAALVDPYGTITDAVTHLPIEGAKVVLHYANTARNKAKGLILGAAVTLPALVGFEPNNNASPDQLSDIHGFYAYMVYPETDYYVVVTKTGYHNYTSPTLSVEWAIVKHDVALLPIQTSVPSPPHHTEVPSTSNESNISLNLSLDKNKVKEGGDSQITVTYKNDSNHPISSGEIKVTLPAGVIVVDPAGGTVTGNTIVWKLSNLATGQVGNYKLIVKWPLLDGVEKIYDISGVFTANSASTGVRSSVKINVFSDRFGELKHYRYILGYPDKEFKLNKSMTRAEVAAIVARLTENVDIDYALPYKDIRPGHWATNYIRIATKHGYFSGGKDGLFRPDAPITRGELASVMARFLELEISKPTKAHFSDTSGHWAGNMIESLYNSKFLTGYTNGTFKPDNHIVRVEAVTMINRMLYRGPLLGLTPLFPDVPVSHWGFGDVQESTVSHEFKHNVDGSETWVQSLSDDMK
ncbi:S-layer homology domain-containing protein [Paenibacillus macquariensis]|uniref:S-layer homology domain-containing protein n=1 Tax=Paenibacillus macquariensis TaxID=948756 RepID=A0ABY1K4E5_9BACL|nr:S-layer homology domain-containing protein [Paenibacillus macquariensis]MEC0088981.1 S-layer homology domain-containing protein [Paenibacillus macquariensis]OAB31878.1 hypothetical protein PMSM_18785 [Paenibacillus macquariensis subsp. macquariensis]SIR23914.1 S-layer homology domain-containing protein [Paenibacillus macquariensis]